MTLVRGHNSWCLEVMIFEEQQKCEARSNAEKHVLRLPMKTPRVFPASAGEGIRARL